MAAVSAIVEQVIRETLEQVEKSAPMSYKNVTSDPAKWDALNQAIRDTACEEVRLAQEIRERRPKDMDEWLARCLPDERMEMIREALNIPTFKMNVRKSKDGRFEVKVTTEGNWFLASRELESPTEVDWAIHLQYASILVEAVLLCLSAVGIRLTPAKAAMEAAVDDAAHIIEKSSKVQHALLEFISEWKVAGSHAYHRAKALFILLKKSHGDGHLWSIIKALCKGMKWYEWLETAAKATAMLVAALATDGVALIAKIAVTVLSAAHFDKKVENVVKLSEIKQELLN